MLAAPTLLRLPACPRGAVPARAGLRAALPRVLRASTPAARGRRVCRSAETGASACAAAVAPALACAGELASSFDASGAQALYQLAVLDPAGAAAVGAALGPLFSLATLLFIVRIVMTWYPDIKDDAFPWIIVYAPTEPLLAPTRKIITPVGGVDVSPIVWVALTSFLNEILVGKQGLLVLLAQKVA